MRKKTTKVSRFCLAGDWTIRGAAEQYARLSSQFPLLSEFPPANKKTSAAEVTSPEIDLGGISALDACGCQLLALFAHTLHECGISPRFINVPEAYQATIRLLGFDRELARSL